MTIVKAVLPECVVAVTIFTLALIIGSSISAYAHNDVFRDQRWASDPTMYRGYLTDELNTARARTTMYQADNEWDAVSDSTLDFLDSSYQNPHVLYTPNACLVPNNGVWFLQHSWGNSWGGATLLCVAGDDIIKASIVFNTDYTWYTGAGTPPEGEPDLWGTATHELGHAAGFEGHFTGNELCPATSARHTMCGGWLISHLPYARTLEVHDKHSIAAAY